MTNFKKNPKSSPEKLAYMKNYEKSETVKKRIAERVKNRREAEREGLVSKGDGKEIDHKRMLDEGGTNSKGNLRIIDASKNRAWRKDHPEAYGKDKKK